VRLEHAQAGRQAGRQTVCDTVVLHPHGGQVSDAILMCSGSHQHTICRYCAGAPATNATFICDAVSTVCYSHSAVPATFSGARQACQDQGGDLSHFLTALEQVGLQDRGDLHAARCLAVSMVADRPCRRVHTAMLLHHMPRHVVSIAAES
jgi:hypothetical protein